MKFFYCRTAVVAVSGDLIHCVISCYLLYVCAVICKAHLLN